MYVIVHARIVKIWLQVEWIFRLTHYWKEQETGKNIIHSFMRNALQDAWKSYKEGGSEKEFKPLIQQMIEIQEESNNFATSDQMVHHLTTLYSASEDTVSTICAFALVLFGIHPDIQQKVSSEIVHVVGTHGRDIEFENIPKLTYLEMCIKEVLRLFPIAPFLMRVPMQDCTIDKWKIPSACSVVVSIHNIHRDPKHWERPNEFYPEHFLRENVNQRHTYAYMPFSAGPRGCLGKPYAFMAINIILVSILQKYRILANGKLNDYKLKTDISVRFKDNCYPIKLERRMP